MVSRKKFSKVRKERHVYENGVLVVSLDFGLGTNIEFDETEGLLSVTYKGQVVYMKKLFQQKDFSQYHIEHTENNGIFTLTLDPRDPIERDPSISNSKEVKELVEKMEEATEEET